MPRFLKVLLFILVIVAGLLFHLRNNQAIALDYYLGLVEIPMSVLVVLILALGVGLGYVVNIPTHLRLKRDNARLQKQLNLTEKEVNALRVVPLKDDL